jgi:hypothetical protein
MLPVPLLRPLSQVTTPQAKRAQPPNTRTTTTYAKRECDGGGISFGGVVAGAGYTGSS